MCIRNINIRLLNWYQRQVNKQYEKYGLTDKVLEHQIRINKIRADHNIPDENDIITNDGYVQ